jgi:cell division protein FtsB
MGLGVMLGLGVYKLTVEKNALAKETKNARDELNELNEEKKSLEEEMSYLANPENILKQLKTRFNYRKPGENMMIIVP